jgi:acetyl esterase/lipase
VISSADLAWNYELLKLPSRDPVRANPLLVESAALLGLPHTYIQVSGMDPLRGHGLLYTQQLKMLSKIGREDFLRLLIAHFSSVDVDSDVYPGVPHAFYHVPILATSIKYDSDLDRNILRILGI